MSSSPQHNVGQSTSQPTMKLSMPPSPAFKVDVLKSTDVATESGEIANSDARSLLSSRSLIASTADLELIARVNTAEITGARTIANAGLKGKQLVSGQRTVRSRARALKIYETKPFLVCGPNQNKPADDDDKTAELDERCTGRITSRTVSRKSARPCPVSMVSHSPSRQTNIYIKAPFKHNINPQTDSQQKSQVPSPGESLYERTRAATRYVHRRLTHSRSVGAKQRAGKLLRGKLKPLDPVHTQGPTIRQCRGIIAGAKNFGPPLCRSKKHASISEIRNESLHYTSGASSISGRLEEDVDLLDCGYVELVDTEENPLQDERDGDTAGVSSDLNVTEITSALKSHMMLSDTSPLDGWRANSKSQSPLVISHENALHLDRPHSMTNDQRNANNNGVTCASANKNSNNSISGDDLDRNPRRRTVTITCSQTVIDYPHHPQILQFDRGGRVFDLVPKPRMKHDKTPERPATSYNDNKSHLTTDVHNGPIRPSTAGSVLSKNKHVVMQCKEKLKNRINFLDSPRDKQVFVNNYINIDSRRDNTKSEVKGNSLILNNNEKLSNSSNSNNKVNKIMAQKENKRRHNVSCKTNNSFTNHDNNDDDNGDDGNKYLQFRASTNKYYKHSSFSLISKNASNQSNGSNNSGKNGRQSSTGSHLSADGSRSDTAGGGSRNVSYSSDIVSCSDNCLTKYSIPSCHVTIQSPTCKNQNIQTESNNTDNNNNDRGNDSVLVWSSDKLFLQSQCKPDVEHKDVAKDGSSSKVDSTMYDNEDSSKVDSTMYGNEDSSKVDSTMYGNEDSSKVLTILPDPCDKEIVSVLHQCDEGTCHTVGKNRSHDQDADLINKFYTFEELEAELNSVTSEIKCSIQTFITSMETDHLNHHIAKEYDNTNGITAGKNSPSFDSILKDDVVASNSYSLHSNNCNNEAAASCSRSNICSKLGSHNNCFIQGKLSVTDMISSSAQSHCTADSSKICHSQEITTSKTCDREIVRCDPFIEEYSLNKHVQMNHSSCVPKLNVQLKENGESDSLNLLKVANFQKTSDKHLNNSSRNSDRLTTEAHHDYNTHLFLDPCSVEAGSVDSVQYDFQSEDNNLEMKTSSKQIPKSRNEQNLHVVSGKKRQNSKDCLPIKSVNGTKQNFCNVPVPNKVQICQKTVFNKNTTIKDEIKQGCAGVTVTCDKMNKMSTTEFTVTGKGVKCYPGQNLTCSHVPAGLQSNSHNTSKTQRSSKDICSEHEENNCIQNELNCLVPTLDLTKLQSRDDTDSSKTEEVLMLKGRGIENPIRDLVPVDYKIESRKSETITKSKPDFNEDTAMVALQEDNVSVSSVKAIEGCRAEDKTSLLAVISEQVVNVNKSLVTDITQSTISESDVTSLSVVATSKELVMSKVKRGEYEADTQAPVPLNFRINARPPPGHLFYFAYADNMNTHRMRTYLQRDMTDQYWGILFGFHLVFNKCGVDREAGGFANITYEACQSVEGRVYVITPDELAMIDQHVGYPQHYEHLVLPVWIVNSSDPDLYSVAQYCVPAVMYIAQDAWITTDVIHPCELSLGQSIKGSDQLTSAYREQLLGQQHHATAISKPISNTIVPVLA